MGLGLQSVRCTHVTIDEEQKGSAVKEVFTDFVTELVSILREKQEREELGIVGKKKR